MVSRTARARRGLEVRPSYTPCFSAGGVELRKRKNLFKYRKIIGKKKIEGQRKN